MDEIKDSDKNDNKKVLMRWQVKLQLNDFPCYHFVSIKNTEKHIHIRYSKSDHIKLDFL